MWWCVNDNGSRSGTFLEPIPDTVSRSGANNDYRQRGYQQDFSDPLCSPRPAETETRECRRMWRRRWFSASYRLGLFECLQNQTHLAPALRTRNGQTLATTEVRLNCRFSTASRTTLL